MCNCSKATYIRVNSNPYTRLSILSLQGYWKHPGRCVGVNSVRRWPFRSRIEHCCQGVQSFSWKATLLQSFNPN